MIVFNTHKMLYQYQECCGKLTDTPLDELCVAIQNQSENTISVPEGISLCYLLSCQHLVTRIVRMPLNNTITSTTTTPTCSLNNTLVPSKENEEEDENIDDNDDVDLDDDGNIIFQ